MKKLTFCDIPPILRPLSIETPPIPGYEPTPPVPPTPSDLEQRVEALENGLSQEIIDRRSGDAQLDSKIVAANAKISEIEIDVNDMQSSIEEIESKLHGKTKIAFIGDSWSDADAYSALWTFYISSYLNMEAVRLASRGAGFHRKNNLNINMIDQMQTLARRDDLDDIGLTFIYGGVNDYRYNSSVSDVLGAMASMKQTADAIRSNHDMEFVVCFGNAFYQQETDASFMSYYNNVMNGARGDERYRIGTMPYGCPSWLTNYGAAAYNSDQRHPSEVGHSAIASQMLSIIQGGYSI